MTNAAPLWVLVVLAVVSISVFIGRLWIKATIDHGIRAMFERDLEAYKSDLRAREATVTGLQAAILSGRTGRTAIVEKRQIEAAEAVWAEMVRLRAANMAVMSLRLMNLEEVAKRIEHDTRVREFVQAMKGNFELAHVNESSIGLHEPFVSEVLWSRFSAYRAILLHAVATLEMLGNGINDVEKYLNQSHLVTLAKEMLPDSVGYLDRVGLVGVYYLIDKIEALILASVRDEIAGVEADAQAVAQAKRVSRLAQESEEAKNVAAAAIPT